MGVEKFQITVTESELKKINKKTYRGLDIVDGNDKSILKDGGVQVIKYQKQFLGAAVQTIVYRLLKQYNPGTDDIKTLCNGEKDKEKIVFYKSEQSESGKADKYVSVKNNVSRKTYSFAAAKTRTLKLIVDNEGREWKASDGTALAIDTNIDNNIKIANLAKFCQLVVPREEQGDCQILLDYE